MYIERIAVERGEKDSIFCDNLRGERLPYKHEVAYSISCVKFTSDKIHMRIKDTISQIAMSKNVSISTAKQ